MPWLVALLAAASFPAAGHQVFAHRGASGYLPEHGLPAKAMAHAQGADFLEQDVVLTKDGVPVVLHDVHLDALTDVARRFPDRKRADVRYYAIDFTLAEVRELEAGPRLDPATGEPVYPGRFPPGGPAGRLHTLEDEIRFIQGLNASTGREAGLFVEVKQPTFHRNEGRDVARAVFDVLTRHGYGADETSACWVQCFEKSTLDRFRKEFGFQGRLMLIFAAKRAGADGTDYDRLSTPEGLEELAGVVDGVFPNLDRVVTWDGAGTPRASDFARNARRAGLRVVTGVVRRDDLPRNCPSVEALHEAIFTAAGVDDVCTDFPDLSVRWLRDHPPR